MSIREKFTRTFWASILSFISIDLVAADVHQIQTLINNRQYRAAYELAEAMASDYAGDPQFDFYYGQAALNTDHADVAVFAFERVVMASPQNRLAWYELGLAYYYTKDYKAARRVFKKLIAHHCKDNVCATSGDFLQKTEKKTRKKNRSLSGELQFTPGYDTNVNSTTFASTVLVPFVGPVPLKGSSRGVGSTYTTYKGHLEYLEKITNKTQFFTELHDIGVVNYSAHDFDDNSFFVSPGIKTRLGKYKIKIPVFYRRLIIDDDFFSETVGAGIEVRRKINPAHELALEGEFGKSDYFVPVRNANNSLVTGKWTFTPQKYPYEIEVHLYKNFGTALDASGAYLIKDYYGTRLHAKWLGIPRYEPHIIFNYINSDFLAPNPRFLVTRRDSFYNVLVGVQWECTPTFLIKPAYGYTYNSSTLPTVNYDRNIVQINFTYKFVV